MPDVAPESPAVRPARYDRIDALRAVAMLWMTAFHFCFDLDHFGYWQQSFLRDPFWTTQRTAIVSLFLLCAGLGQAVAFAQGQSWPRFWRRWGQVAGAALLVTAGSALMFPRTYIYFGVLHGIAVMLVVVRFTAHWDRRWLVALGALVIASKFVAAALLATPAGAPFADLFNSKALNWLGWVTHKPATEDYVPIAPWLGVMWWGVALGGWLLEHRRAWLQAPVGSRPGRALAWLGRWSLSYYLVHQPVMIGALLLVRWI